MAGDVEIHVTPANWNHHGHGNDPRFKNVIAHVTWTEPSTPTPNLPPGTIEISLEKPLKSNQSFSFESIDTTAYPYSVFPTEVPPCALELKDWNQDDIAKLLESAGAHRMQIKARNFSRKLADTTPDQLLYEEILAALGYKHNTAAFRTLAQTLNISTISKQAPLSAYVLMLGISRLIPDKPSPHWDKPTKAFVRHIWDTWWTMQDAWQEQLLPKGSWRLSSIRPQNHPVRRLAAAAAFACHQQPPTRRLAEIATSLKNTDSRNITGKLAPLFIAPPPLDYWHQHISLASPQRQKPIAIIGKARLAAIYINVMLPFLSATRHDISGLTEQIPPEQNNSIIKRCAHSLLGRDHNPDLYSKNALRQQGLIQIFHDFCLPDRSACRDCPLPAALRKSHPAKKSKPEPPA
jgi:hypothetical protein